MALQEEHNHIQEQSSSADLWLEVKAGNRLAFSHLYGKYSKELFQYGYRWTSDKVIIEDVIHDVFVNIWMTKDQLKINALKPYLLTCVRNAILRKLSGERKFSFVYAQEDVYIANLRSEEESLLEEEILVKRIRGIVDQLTNRQREIIHLKFYQNLTYPEISELLGIDIKHIYNLASKAYSFIRDHIRSTSTMFFLSIVSYWLSIVNCR